MPGKQQKYKGLRKFANKHKNATVLLGSVAIGLILHSILPDPADAVALITCLTLGVLYLAYSTTKYKKPKRDKTRK